MNWRAIKTPISPLRKSSGRKKDRKVECQRYERLEKHEERGTDRWSVREIKGWRDREM
jgi:hypothetical protein